MEFLQTSDTENVKMKNFGPQRTRTRSRRISKRRSTGPKSIRGSVSAGSNGFSTSILPDVGTPKGSIKSHQPRSIKSHQSRSAAHYASSPSIPITNRFNVPTNKPTLALSKSAESLDPSANESDGSTTQPKHARLSRPRRRRRQKRNDSSDQTSRHRRHSRIGSHDSRHRSNSHKHHHDDDQTSHHHGSRRHRHHTRRSLEHKESRKQRKEMDIPSPAPSSPRGIDRVIIPSPRTIATSPQRRSKKQSETSIPELEFRSTFRQLGDDHSTRSPRRSSGGLTLFTEGMTPTRGAKGLTRGANGPKVHRRLSGLDLANTVDTDESEMEVSPNVHQFDPTHEFRTVEMKGIANEEIDEDVPGPPPSRTILSRQSSNIRARKKINKVFEDYQTQAMVLDSRSEEAAEITRRLKLDLEDGFTDQSEAMASLSKVMEKQQVIIRDYQKDFAQLRMALCGKKMQSGIDLHEEPGTPEFLKVSGHFAMERLDSAFLAARDYPRDRPSLTQKHTLFDSNSSPKFKIKKKRSLFEKEDSNQPPTFSRQTRAMSSMTDVGPTLPVFLGGACNPTTWRMDAAIPALKKAGIDFYNPQIDDWHPDLVPLERKAKNEARVLFFVINEQTRALASTVEVAEFAARNRMQRDNKGRLQWSGNDRQHLIVFLKDIPPDATIAGDPVSVAEAKDINRARHYLSESLTRNGHTYYHDLTEAINEVVNMCTLLGLADGTKEGVDLADTKNLPLHNQPTSPAHEPSPAPVCSGSNSSSPPSTP